MTDRVSVLEELFWKMVGGRKAVAVIVGEDEALSCGSSGQEGRSRQNPEPVTGVGGEPRARVSEQPPELVRIGDTQSLHMNMFALQTTALVQLYQICCICFCFKREGDAGLGDISSAEFIKLDIVRYLLKQVKLLNIR